ncbi:MAG TPA: hypothetical protein PLF13_06120 [candidate division Zixibacteria bacterium]|nr:hypothetical protein [candidate division Zixibacteria bacterium]
MVPENIPRLLSESEYRSLLGDLSNLGLPESARLYLVAGLPQVFKRICNDADKCFEASWLYVPLSQVKSLRQHVIVEASRLSRSGISRHAVRAEGVKLFPIVCSGEFAGFLSVPRGEPIQFDDTLLDSLLERLEVHFDHVQSENSSIVRDFVQRLYRRDQSFQAFLKSALQLMSDQWERSMGAVYYDLDGIYNMRMALGDIQFGDVLPSEVKQSTARDWVDAVRRSEYFVPAELLPDSPIFLSMPPTFIFVHPAITSSRTEFLLAVAISGDIDHQAISNIQEVAGLVSDLDESQFATSFGLIELYSQLGDLIHAAPIRDEILLDIFKRLSQQMKLSRMLLVSASGPVSKVKQRRQQEPELSIEERIPVPDQAIKAVSSDKSILLDDFRKQFGNSELSKLYYLDDVASELIIPIRWSNQEWSYIAFGTPLSAAYLEEHRRLLEFAARYVEICLLFIRRGWWQRQVSDDDSKAPENGESNDLRKISGRLADGILHALLEQLSVVLGQGEIMEDELSTAIPGEDKNEQLEGTRRINRAATSIAEYVEHLRWLQKHCDPCTENELVEVVQLVDEVPAVLSGYIRDLKARKRIDIKIWSECDGEIREKVTRSTVVTTILPLLVTILDEAICSGDITIRWHVSEQSPILSCEFAENLIGHIDLAGLVDRVYPSHRASIAGQQTGRTVLKSAVLDYRAKAERCYMDFRFVKMDNQNNKSSFSTLKEAVH